jgi:hypothetical protein
MAEMVRIKLKRDCHKIQALQADPWIQTTPTRLFGCSQHGLATFSFIYAQSANFWSLLILGLNVIYVIDEDS